MIRKFKYGLLVISFGLFSQAAIAGLHIEPYLSFVASGDAETTFSTNPNNNFDSDISGQAIGARVGYSLPLGLAFGLDYSQGSYSIDPDNSAEVDSDGTDLGAFVSFDLPILFRVYGTYILDSTQELEGGTELSGNGFKLGVGFTGLPFVSLNLNYITNTYDEQDPTVNGREDNFNLVMLSLSLPLDL